MILSTVTQDYDGQRKAEKIFQTIVLVFAVAGLGYGFQMERFSYTVYTLGVGFLIACVVSVKSTSALIDG